jgi:peptidoglycan biosynthesis protein MviN/MurJ (putative lipid II flippase)
LLIVFFSYRKIWITVIAAVSAFLMNVLGGLFLMRPWGILGLSGAILLSSILNLGLMIHFFNTRIFKLAWAEVLSHCMKVLTLAGTMAVLTMLLESVWKNQTMLNIAMPVKLSTTVAASAAFYMGLGYWLKFNEIVAFVGKFKNAIKR